MSAERQAAELKKPLIHPDYYFPRGECPDPSELGITKADLEAFEMRLCKSANAKLEKSLNAKERDSLLKLVLGMAIDGYGYDHKASRSPAAREIASGLMTRGITIDEDTVRKWLNQAKEEHAPEIAA